MYTFNIPSGAFSIIPDQLGVLVQKMNLVLAKVARKLCSRIIEPHAYDVSQRASNTSIAGPTPHGIKCHDREFSLVPKIRPQRAPCRINELSTLSNRITAFSIIIYIVSGYWNYTTRRVLLEMCNFRFDKVPALHPDG